MNTEITTQVIEASHLSLPTNPAFPFFATVRLKKDTRIALDGCTYTSEAAMRRFRSSRPKNAVMLKITSRLESKSGGRYFSAEVVDA
jgi:hypothetical protein